MTKMKKLASVMIAVMFMAAFVLSSCSGSGSGNAIPFSETISGEEVCIWYECQNKIEETDGSVDLDNLFGDDTEEQSTEPVEYGRETRVVWIRVYKNGKLSTYSAAKNVYLGYFAKMTDEEIVKALDTDKDTFICAQKDQPFDIYLYSDSTGHEIKFEGVPTLITLDATSDPMYFMTLISSETVPTFQVYDSYYGGFTLYNYDEKPFGEACLVTRCESGTVYCLDPLDLEGAILDYATPEDMLLEKNDELKAKQHPEGETEEGETAEGETGENPDAEDGTGY